MIPQLSRLDRESRQAIVGKTHIHCVYCGTLTAVRDFPFSTSAECWDCVFKDLRTDLFGRWPKLRLPWWKVAA